ncbi:hypothetical protein SNE40_013951 [Patella caerulea]|uniref:ILEI/PANDER domain-containing protein n=1 Tax=Patella caerulea TaxID=87958 RepID=A0AAN8PPR6_PATCE
MRVEKSKLLRQIRRIINRKFGGWKKFILLTVCICVILYCINSLFSRSGRQVWDVGGEGLNVTDDRCGVKCNAGQHSFYIRTGDGSLVGPTICFEGDVIVSNELKNFGRGLNVVLINDRTLEVADIKTFDTYEEESSLIRFLKKSVPDNFVVMMASFDDAASSLKEDSIRWLKLYGSTIVDDLTLRDGYIMVGQKGLEEGQAIEFIKKKYRKEFADVMEIAGCLEIPLGSHRNLQLMLPEVINEKDMVIGEAVANCGVEKICEPNSFPVRIDTGYADKRPVEICVNGHIMMGENLNKGGRGFNVIIVDPVDQKPSIINHVDTYTFDSTDLEIFLESLVEGDIIIAAVCDDGSRKLSYAVKKLLNKLGSGHIQNLRFRDVWYFVGQKGMSGFTTFEQISYAGVESEWPKEIKKAFCVPTKLIGRQVIPDPEVYRNDERRAFCVKYGGYSELCDPAHVDDLIKPVKVINKQMEANKVYATPIIIIPGMNHNALVRTLQTTLMQPGINTALVTIIWDEKFPEHGDLAQLFGFNNRSVSGSLQYSEQVLKALKLAVDQHTDVEYLIVLEEELILAPDFLNFMAQCVEILNADETLLGVSAWNFNGYEDVSGNKELVYRVEEFPGLGLFIKTSALQRLFQYDNIKQCCNKRSWYGWNVNSLIGGEILIPDVSRVFRQVYQGADNLEDYIQALFNRPRLTNLEQETTLGNMNNLAEKVYEDILQEELTKATILTTNQITQCYQKGSFIKEFNQSAPGIPIIVSYTQESENDLSLLQKLCKCFGLFSSTNSKPKNLHHGLVRFYYLHRNIYLVGSSTRYYSYVEDKLKIPIHVNKDEYLKP